MGLHCGIDLRFDNSRVTIFDESRKTVLSRDLPNCIGDVLDTLQPFREDLDEIAVESALDWYWLVDGLMEAGYEVLLVGGSPTRLVT